MLEAGDVLYNPQMWWHQVRSYDAPNIGVSLWFGQFRVSFDDDAPDWVSYKINRLFLDSILPWSSCLSYKCIYIYIYIYVQYMIFQNVTDSITSCNVIYMYN